LHPHRLDKKRFGVFAHRSLDFTHPLMRGLDDVFYVPHSREWELLTSDIAKVKDLQIISYSDVAGVHIISDMECRNIFITGHSEYDRNTLAKEYFRDLNKGLPIDIPVNYFPDDDINLVPLMNWRGTGNLIFSNWLNYFVYQKTPYDLSEL
jgi:homoserine O-succinyltransferase